MLNIFSKNSRKPDWGFQTKAVSNLTSDFSVKPKGRFLLVLPTGGGKTLVAIQTVNSLLKKGLINREDKVMWVVHTLSLKKQAQDNLDNEDHYNGIKLSLDRNVKGIIKVQMKAEALSTLQNKSDYKLIIIDEAHHAAAQTYQDFFDYPIGILGLTATPRRMDSVKLPFDKVSYSITFKELVKRNVVLLPKFIPEIQTNIEINASSLDSEEQLEKFNTIERNELVAQYIFDEKYKHNFNKVVVFASTNKHVEQLYDAIKTKNARLGKPFEHIGYIYGGNNNEKGLSNEDYFTWHSGQKSSVLINCKLLNEGYDDPGIDVVVMAAPTNSILYYLQCIGRVVRNPSDQDGARAFVIEIIDKLPNISYRIDNRWLFAEISDYLEPRIKDVKSFWPLKNIKILIELIKLRAKLTDIGKKNLVSLVCGRPMNLLLFNDVPYNRSGRWRVMPIKENEIDKIKFFNDISENIEEYHNLNHDYILETKYRDFKDVIFGYNRVYRSTFMAALKRALDLKNSRKKVDSLIYLSTN